jgi:hypothetical protein
LAKKILAELGAGEKDGILTLKHDGSTSAVIRKCLKERA